MVGTVIAKVKGSSAGDDYTMPASDGASGTYLKTDGSGNLSFGAIATAGFHKVTVFTSSSSAGGYSPDTGVTKLIVEVQGGGGNAGNNDGSGYEGGSGGGGGYAMKYLSGMSSSDTMTITVGGITGTSSFARVGGTAFTTITCAGGTTGANASGGGGTGGTGGAASDGDLNINGGSGRFGGGSDAGGSSVLGIGGIRHNGAASTPTAAAGYGGGGGVAGGLSQAGGAGSAGVVIVWEYK